MSEAMLAPIGRVAVRAAAGEDVAPARPPTAPAQATAGMASDPERSRSASESSPAVLLDSRPPAIVPTNPPMVAHHVQQGDCAENGRSSSPSSAGSSTGKEGSAAEDTSAPIGGTSDGTQSASSQWAEICDDKWKSRFEEMRRFKAARGHCRASQTKDGQLGQWVKKQRERHQQWTHSGRPAGVVADRMEALRGLGFEFSVVGRSTVFKSLPELWFARLEALKAFKLRHGHCRVPRRGDYATLSNWAKEQRRNYRDRFHEGKSSPMTDERFEALEALDFEWENDQSKRVDTDKWYQRLQQLKEFKHKHGHCCVRRHDDESLCSWIKEQRKTYSRRSEGKTSPMTDERVTALEGIGFLWDAKQETELAERRGTLKRAPRAPRAPRSRAPAPPRAAMTASELKAKQLRLEQLRDKRKKENDKRKKEHEQAQQALHEEQERLFREAAARVRSQQQQGPAPCPGTAPKVFSRPVEDLSDLDDSHWKWSDPYARLGLPQSSSLVAIKKQYRKFSLLYHPDKSSRVDALERFHAVKEAYECLVEKAS